MARRKALIHENGKAEGYPILPKEERREKTIMISLSLPKGQVK